MAAIASALPAFVLANELETTLDRATAEAIAQRIDVIVTATSVKVAGSQSLSEFGRRSEDLKREMMAIANALEFEDRAKARRHTGRAKLILMEMNALARDLNVSLTKEEMALVERFLRSS